MIKVRKKLYTVGVFAMHPTRRAPGAILCAALSALFIPVISKAQPNYLVPLPQKGTAIQVNNSGQVLYDTGLLTGNTFTPFPVNFTLHHGQCCAGILSDTGAVVGNTTTGDIAVYSTGTVTDLGQPSFVPPPPQGQWDVSPTAINASGQIVGSATTGGFPPFIYSGGVFNAININDPNGSPLGPPTPNAMNDSGQVVLCGPAEPQGSDSFLLTGETVTALPPGCAYAINASGQITGETGDSQSSHAYIWANGKLTTLAEPSPFTSSQGFWINKGGQIVGNMSNGQTSVPFFYNGVMTDINALISTSDPLKSSVTIAWVANINDSRLLLVVSTVPVVGSSTAYLLQAPWLDVAPGPLTFASQAVGTTSQPQTLTLTNSGTAPLPLDGISIAGATDFSQTNACPPSLTAGTNCTVSVTFSPSAAGSQNAILNVVTGGATITVPLSATTPITVTLSATSASASVGQPFTISWTSTPGATCQSSGGAPNDGWSTASASGSASVTETKPGTYTYSLTCTAGTVGAAKSLTVMVANPPASGGGGGLDLFSLLLLGGLLVINSWRRGHVQPETNSRFMPRVVLASCAMLGAAFWHSPAEAQANLIDLGATTGHAINNKGQVALDAGIYSNGTTTPLPAFPGQLSAGPPLAISSSGEVAGSATIPGWGLGGPVATAYIGGTAINLFSSFTGREQDQTGTGTGVNSSGTVVGWIYTFNVSGPGAPIVGFNYNNGVLTPMSVPCGPNSNTDCTGIAWNYIYGINDNNQIIGSVTYQPGTYCTTNNAYLYDNGVWTDMGTGSAFAINSSGQITGTRTVFQQPCVGGVLQVGSYAFLYSNGATLNLGTLPGGKNSNGYAINTTGQVVGASDFTGNTTTHAFFYNGVMTDMNSMVSATDPQQPYVTLTDARGIDDTRLIVVNGVDSRTGLTHAYLMQGPWIDIAPGPLSFASTAVGASSQAQQVTVTNSGTTALALGALSASKNFSQTNSCGSSLAPSTSCSVQVTFTPAMAGGLAGGLTITSAGVNYVVGLSGNAPISASLSASSATGTVGVPITLTWMSSPGSTCTASASNQNPAFTGAIAESGKVSFTEAATGMVSYGIHCTASGTPEVDPVTTVTWNWPAVTATLAASPMTITTGQSVTLAWSSSSANGCTASGGGPGDGWSGSKSTTGNQTVTESYALATSSVALNFTITCASSASGLSSTATASVTENAPPSKGGGGALDGALLAFLAGLLARRRVTASGFGSSRESQSGQNHWT